MEQLGLFEVVKPEYIKLGQSESIYHENIKLYHAALDGIREAFNHHKFILKNGENDPFWPDGVNANLVRNHIFYYKKVLAEFKEVLNFTVPPEFFLETPKKINPNAMFSDRKLLIDRKPDELFWDGNEDGN